MVVDLGDNISTLLHYTGQGALGLVPGCRKWLTTAPGCPQRKDSQDGLNAENVFHWGGHLSVSVCVLCACPPIHACVCHHLLANKALWCLILLVVVITCNHLLNDMSGLRTVSELSCYLVFNRCLGLLRLAIWLVAESVNKQTYQQKCVSGRWWKSWNKVVKKDPTKTTLLLSADMLLLHFLDYLSVDI